MTIASALTPERFDALAHQLTARVNAVVPAATLELAHDDNGYCCASWRLHGRGERELFIEQPGSVIAPFILRVGVYFQDAPLVTARRDVLDAALEALTTHRTALEALGISCTFTPGSATRDDTVFSWSDRDLTDWLVGASDNRDLVWRWDFRKGAPAQQQLEDVLEALLPVWVAWNSL
jgi:hypothetical protein